MNTLFTIIGVLSIIIGVIQVGCPNLVEQKYYRHSKEHVRRYAFFAAVGNSLFGTGLILGSMLPEVFNITITSITLSGLAVEYFAHVYLKHEKVLS